CAQQDFSLVFQVIPLFWQVKIGAEHGAKRAVTEVAFALLQLAIHDSFGVGGKLIGEQTVVAVNRFAYHHPASVGLTSTMHGVRRCFHWISPDGWSGLPCA